MSSNAIRIEREHVQDVYEKIGAHFSETRYKPWPLIEQFLASMPAGYIGLDAGSGNGKYLGLGSILHQQKPGLASKTLLIGLDHARALCDIAHSRGHEVLQGDGIAMPWREGVFVRAFALRRQRTQDFVISIATIHHFASVQRRKEAVKSLLRALNPRHGRLLVQVWALEQGDEATLLKGKGRQTAPLPGGQDEQDVLIPWRLQQASHHVSAIHHRYYRLFREGELLQLVQDAAIELGMSIEQDDAPGPKLIVDRSIFERGNWLIECHLRVTSDHLSMQAAAQRQQAARAVAEQQKRRLTGPTPVADPDSAARAAKKRKPTDKSLPPFESTSSILPTSTPLPSSLIESNEALAELADGYAELQRIEKSLDRMITRKRTELGERLVRPWTAKRKLRLTLRTECEHQTWQNGGEAAADEAKPKWTFKIEGRVLPTDRALSEGSEEPTVRFSDVVSRAMIEGEGSFGRIEWQRPAEPVDGFSFTREGTENVRLRIILALEQSPDRHKLPVELGNLLDLRSATMPAIVAAIWAYARKHNLVDSETGKLMTCDEPLRRILGIGSIPFSGLQSHLMRIVGKGEPIELRYTVVVNAASEPTSYEMSIELDDPGKPKVQAALASAAAINTTETDDDLALKALAIRQARLKRDFLAGFADDPVNFLEIWTASQANDLGTILGESTSDDLRRAETYHTPWLVDSIRLHDGRRIVQGTVPQRPAAAR